VAASVTPCRHDTGATVLDERWQVNAQLSAASLGGDVVGTDQIPMPVESAVCTAEPATFRLGHALPADRAGGGGATLVDQVHLDAREFGLVAQRLQQVGAAPPPQPQVLYPAGVVVGDPFGVTDQ
jgi:hypothetical protein